MGLRPAKTHCHWGTGLSPIRDWVHRPSLASDRPGPEATRRHCIVRGCLPSKSVFDRYGSTTSLAADTRMRARVEG
jgi:hypothetical protein